MTTPLPHAGQWTTADLPDQTGRTVMVTGGNSGLGFETCKAFAARGAAVAMASRDVEWGRIAAERVRGDVRGLPARVDRLLGPER